MKYILRFIKGIAIGAGAILPGISSGVLCVIFNIYDTLIESILGFFKNVRKNAEFLVPIALGTFVGVMLFGNILQYLFNTFPNQTNFAFIGLIIGCLPSIFKKANEKNGFKLHYLLYFIVSLIIALFLIFLESNLNYEINSITQFNFMYLVMSGFVMSVGIIVPGISSTVLLMILGVYYTYLNAITTLDFSVLLPMGIGLMLGGLLLLKIIQFLLKKYSSQTFYCIIGFVVGSVFILYPRIFFKFRRLNFSYLLWIRIFYSYQIGWINLTVGSSILLIVRAIKIAPTIFMFLNLYSKKIIFFFLKSNLFLLL